MTHCPKCGYPITLTDNMQHPVGDPVEVIPVRFGDGKMVAGEPLPQRWQWVEWHIHCPFCGHDFKA